MTSLAQWKAEQARVWGAAPWQGIAGRVLSAIHEELMAWLAPHPGEPWLDLATGTRAVAVRAASAGVAVSALDLSPALVRTARQLAANLEVSVCFTVRDVERLPYPDASFDVVSSAHGVVFAADHRAMARELARVCKPGGRIGLTYWRSNPELDELMRRVGNARPPTADNPLDCRHPRYVKRLLGADFDLVFAEETCLWTAKSGEAAWRLLTYLLILGRRRGGTGR